MKRYQIFISSTYTDLIEERSAVLESVLKLRHIPVGMEHFVATNEEQFNYIKKLLEDTDYYIVIIGNRYGSIADDGISYTEKEFDYAVSLGIPVIACIHNNPESLPMNKSDLDDSAKEKLKKFREKVMKNRMVSYINWTLPASLTSEVVVALVNTINDYPRPGWERVGSYDNSDLLSQINDLRLENEKLKSRIQEIEASEHTKKMVELFPWDETLDIRGCSSWEEYKDCTIIAKISWKQIFAIIGRCLLINNDPHSVHYSLNYTLFLNQKPYFSVPDYEFQVIIAEFLRLQLVEVFDKKIYLTKEGKNFLYSQERNDEKELELIHQQVERVLKKERTIYV